ncbi:MAG TPA: hypothetical protein VFE47_30635 [Tepidisphaeraceae bacterium]|jgi:hypothetical protein|nr:hypothetical protein [Tepidisphaeraceae bacterium]
MADKNIIRYAPSKSKRRLRWKLLVGLAFALSLVIAIPLTRITRRLEYLKNQKRLMDFSYSANEIILEDNAHRIQQLLTLQPPRYLGGLGDGEIERIKPFLLERIPVDGSPKRLRGGTAFLHQRCANGGFPRLVQVAIYSSKIGKARERNINWRVIRPGTFSKNPYVVFSGDASFPTLDSEEMRVFAGEPDPHDPSHFSIQYEIGKSRGVLDGRLQSDDSVVISIRNGPRLK